MWNKIKILFGFPRAPDRVAELQFQLDAARDVLEMLDVRQLALGRRADELRHDLDVMRTERDSAQCENARLRVMVRRIAEVLDEGGIDLATMPKTVLQLDEEE